VALSIPVVWSDEHRLHAPEEAVWIGRPLETDELPARAEAIRATLVGAGASLVPARPHPDDALLAIHGPGLVEFIRNAWADWTEEGFAFEHGQPDVVGYVFPTAGLLSGLEPRVPSALSARTGAFCFDTMTIVTEGTWPAARAAVDVALTAADLVVEGAAVAYACSRPPGHHATRTAFGGSCYLNNAAVAAHRLRTAGHERVAVLDIDAHHGNGAQAIFWDEDDVLTASVHIDPAAGWFPHFLGFAGESGPTNLNVTLAPESGDDAWLEAVDHLVGAARTHGAEALVVPLGVDAAEDDPNSPLLVTEDGFREAGRRLAALGVPTVFVQEGGYVLESLGDLVLAVLEGFEEAS